MDGPRDCHTEWSKSEKEKYCMITLSNNKWYKWTYKTDRNRLTDLKKNLWLPEVRGGDGHVHSVIFEMHNQQGFTV